MKKCKKCGGSLEVAGFTIPEKVNILRCISCGICYLSKTKKKEVKHVQS